MPSVRARWISSRRSCPAGREHARISRPSGRRCTPCSSASKPIRASRTSFAGTGRRNENNYVLSTQLIRRPCPGACCYGGGRAAVPLGEPGRYADHLPALAELASLEKHQCALVLGVSHHLDIVGD